MSEWSRHPGWKWWEPWSALALTPGQLEPHTPTLCNRCFFPLNPNDAPIHRLRIGGLKLRNLQLNADIILKIYVSIKSSPLDGTRPSLLRGFMYIYQGVRREPGVGVKERIGEGGRRGGFRADFPTVYMLISNLTALVLELFIHLNANLFFLSLALSSFVTITFFFFLETLDCWWKNAN